MIIDLHAYYMLWFILYLKHDKIVCLSFFKGPRVLRMTDFACRHPPASLASRPYGAPWQGSHPDNGLRRLEDARAEERRHSKTSSISPSHRSQASLLHWSMDINGSCMECNWLIFEPFKNGDGISAHRSMVVKQIHIHEYIMNLSWAHGYHGSS